MRVEKVSSTRNARVRFIGEEFGVVLDVRCGTSDLASNLESPDARGHLLFFEIILCLSLSAGTKDYSIGKRKK